jgi:hypothetical protein
MEVEHGATSADSGNAAQITDGIVRTLGLTATESSSAAELVAAVQQRVLQATERAGAEYIAAPLLSKPLSATQSVKLAEICSMFNQDYTLRKQMLLQRLDVTIQSFKWSGKAKGKLDAIEALVAPKRKLLQQTRYSARLPSPVKLAHGRTHARTHKPLPLLPFTQYLRVGQRIVC